MTAQFLQWMIQMQFPERLAALRKQNKLTQQALADMIGINVSQLKRYEAGTSQPTLEVLRKLAVALSVSADVLLFDEKERGPNEDLVLQFEAVSQLPPNEQQVIKEVLDGLIIKYQTRRWDSTREQTTS